MNIFKIIRSSEWWEYKLPPLLAIGYATVINYENIYKAIPSILFLIAAIIAGAIYVSIINDVTDMKEDLAGGKYNRISKLEPRARWIILFASVLPAFLFMYLLSDDVLSLIIYILAWVSFSLYSIPPFRFKKRGLWGVLADACGAHFFPSLLFVSGMVHLMNIEMSWIWFTSVGVWSFFYGIRGILWHQFFDRDNDLKIALKTYAVTQDPDTFKKHATWIMCMECAALAVMLWYISKPLPFVALLFYLVFMLGFYKKLGMQIIIIIPPKNHSYHIAMSRYYDVLLPLSLLFTSALIHPYVWIILIVHIILFPRNLKDFFFKAIAVVKKLRPGSRNILVRRELQINKKPD